MYGWNGKILRVELSGTKVTTQKYDFDFATKYMGGRGFAVKTLWDELKPGIDPLGPENNIAAKSPLTGGYGDGNIGTMVAVCMRKAGIDAVIIEGKAQNPVYLYVENEKGYLLSADGIWGETTFETEKRLKEAHGKDVGVLTIGPSGENMVKYATVISQEGRAGGRPGMGAVMGSKKLKAVVFKGTKDIPLADAEGYKRLVNEAYNDIKSRDYYGFWIRQGTMATIEWCNENSVLPTYNFREGIFEFHRLIDGYALEAMKVKRRGCPYCNMACGNVVLDSEGKESELRKSFCLEPNSRRTRHRHDFSGQHPRLCHGSNRERSPQRRNRMGRLRKGENTHPRHRVPKRGTWQPPSRRRPTNKPKTRR